MLTSTLQTKQINKGRHNWNEDANYDFIVLKNKTITRSCRSVRLKYKTLQRVLIQSTSKLAYSIITMIVRKT
jgi:hypothetical protein